jgi:hypothetical protein
VRPRWILGSLVAALVAAAAFAIAFAVGGATVHATADPDPIRLDQGIPVGVLHTPVGALAAGANYMALERRTSATAPAEFRRLLELGWVPSARAVELAAAQQAVLQTPPPRGVHLLTGVAAGKVERYRSDTAQLKLWTEAVYWSAAVAPTQTWALDELALRWSDGRWQVSAHTTDAAPVPGWATAYQGNDTSRAFDADLEGMTAPYYGAR